jgi:hypothetical protein
MVTDEGHDHFVAVVRGGRAFGRVSVKVEKSLGSESWGAAVFVKMDEELGKPFFDHFDNLWMWGEAGQVERLIKEDVGANFVRFDEVGVVLEDVLSLIYVECSGGDRVIDLLCERNALGGLACGRKLILG